MINKYKNLRRQKYIDVLEGIANANIETLVSNTQTKEDVYRLVAEAENAGIGDQDIYTIWGLEARGGIHSQEAFELIRALLGADQGQKDFDLIVTRAINPNDERRLIQVEVKISRDEIIKRLEWITSLDFGDDLDEWREWMEIRLAEGFMIAI